MTRTTACDSAAAMDKPEPEDMPPLGKPGVDDVPLDKPAAEDLPALTSAEYHSLAQKQILNAVFAALAENKMEWATVAPLLDAAREVCAGDFQENAEIRLNTTRAEGDDWVEAEEAFLSISVADRDRGEEWLSQTFWLSDIATAEGDRQQVEAIVAALKRTIAKLEAWLHNPTGGPAEAEPPEEEPKT